MRYEKKYENDPLAYEKLYTVTSQILFENVYFSLTKGIVNGRKYGF